MTPALVQLAYVAASVLFIFALYWMNDPKSARRGVLAGVVAMVLAVAATWIQPAVIHHAWVALAIRACSSPTLIRRRAATTAGSLGTWRMFFPSKFPPGVTPQYSSASGASAPSAASSSSVVHT